MLSPTCAAFEVLEPRSLLNAHLVTTLGPVTLGKDGRISVVTTVMNTGDKVYNGADNMIYFLTSQPATQGWGNGAEVVSSLVTRKLPTIAAHRQAKFTLTFTRPAIHIGATSTFGGSFGASVAPGSYYLNTDHDPSYGMATALTLGLRASTPNTVALDGRFGSVGGGHRALLVGFGETEIPAYGTPGYSYYEYSYSQTPDALTNVKLDGPGWGEIAFDAAHADFVVTLHGTNDRSMLTISGTPGTYTYGNQRLSPTIEDIVINGAMGTLKFDHVAFSGNLTLNNSVKTLDLSGLSGVVGYGYTAQVHLVANASVGELRMGDRGDTDIHLNGHAPTAIHGGVMTRVDITSTAPISVLDVKSWAQSFNLDTIVAPSIQTLTSRGEFDASVTLTGASKGLTLGNVDIKGGSLGVWLINGNAGTVSLNWLVSWNISGNLSSLRLQNDQSYGVLAARNIDKLQFNGNVVGMLILAGANLGADAYPGTNGPGTQDTYAGGTIGSIDAAKIFTGYVLAGVESNGAPFFEGPVPILADALFVPGGPSHIGRITIKRSALGSEFVATSLPSKASINGANVTTAGDPRFVSVL